MNRVFFISACAGLLAAVACHQPASSPAPAPADSSATPRRHPGEIDARTVASALPPQSADAEAPATDGAVPSSSDAAATSTSTSTPTEYRFAHPPAVRNAGGVRVEFLANGHVTLRATDRWHHAINVNYESATFFRNAAPVVARTLTTEQAGALQRVADELEPIR